MIYYYSIIIFLLGISIGSFVNVLIDRIPSGESILIDRSHCDKCLHKLSWYDLLPILSFIFLNRKCRYCRRVISWQYPLVEVINGLLYLIIYYLFSINIIPGSYPTLIYLFILSSGLLAVFMIDLKYRIIPDQMLIAMLAISVIYKMFFHDGDSMQILNAFLSAVIVSLIFMFLVIITKGKGMGMGDVKFSFLMGILLGYPDIIAAFYLSFLTGAAISIILILLNRKKMKETIPFGPFLSAATLITLLFGHNIITFYKHISGF